MRLLDQTFNQGRVNEIAKRLNISKVTLYKYLRHRGVVIHSHRKAATGKQSE